MYGLEINIMYINNENRDHPRMSMGGLSMGFDTAEAMWEFYHRIEAVVFSAKPNWKSIPAPWPAGNTK